MLAMTTIFPITPTEEAAMTDVDEASVLLQLCGVEYPGLALKWKTDNYYGVLLSGNNALLLSLKQVQQRHGKAVWATTRSSIMYAKYFIRQSISIYINVAFTISIFCLGKLILGRTLNGQVPVPTHAHLYS